MSLRAFVYTIALHGVRETGALVRWVVISFFAGAFDLFALSGLPWTKERGRSVKDGEEGTIVKVGRVHEGNTHGLSYLDPLQEKQKPESMCSAPCHW